MNLQGNISIILFSAQIKICFSIISVKIFNCSTSHLQHARAITSLLLLAASRQAISTFLIRTVWSLRWTPTCLYMFLFIFLCMCMLVFWCVSEAACSQLLWTSVQTTSLVLQHFPTTRTSNPNSLLKTLPGAGLLQHPVRLWLAPSPHLPPPRPSDSSTGLLQEAGVKPNFALMPLGSFFGSSLPLTEDRFGECLVFTQQLLTTVLSVQYRTLEWIKQALLFYRCG
jgi:hypothetical protein